MQSTVPTPVSGKIAKGCGMWKQLQGVQVLCGKNHTRSQQTLGALRNCIAKHWQNNHTPFSLHLWVEQTNADRLCLEESFGGIFRLDLCLKILKLHGVPWHWTVDCLNGSQWILFSNS